MVPHDSKSDLPLVSYILNDDSKLPCISLFFCRLYLISRIPNLTYLDDRSVEKEEKNEAIVMFSSSKFAYIASNLRGKTSDFSNFASIESATSALQENNSMGTKIKSYWEDVLKKSPFFNF